MTNIIPPRRSRSAFISIWFILDAVFGLFPPIYWIAGGPAPQIFGLPCSIIYFMALALFIAASIVAAYWDDENRGAFGGSADALLARVGDGHG